jgi:hypothetical protein
MRIIAFIQDEHSIKDIMKSQGITDFSAYSQKIGHLFAERSATPGYPVDNLV